MMSTSKETSADKFFYQGANGTDYNNGININHYIIENNGCAKDVSGLSATMGEGELLVLPFIRALR